MTSAALGPADSGWSRAGFLRLIAAIAIPLALLVLACGLWWISDQLLYIGPLDRAAFGWAIVIPVWCSGPVVAAFAWRELTRRDIKLAAVGFGLVVTAVSSVLFWRSVAFPDCENPIRSAADWILPALVLGLTIGGGLAASGLLGREIVRSGHPWWGVVITAGTEFGMIFVAIFVFVVVAGVGSTAGACGFPN